MSFDNSLPSLLSNVKVSARCDASGAPSLTLTRRNRMLNASGVQDASRPRAGPSPPGLVCSIARFSRTSFRPTQADSGRFSKEARYAGP